MRGLDRIGRPDQLARRRDRLVALEDGGDERPAGDEDDELAEERLLGVLGVVGVRDLLVGGQQPQPGDPQALALEAREDLAGEPALEGVGLDQDQGLECSAIGAAAYASARGVRARATGALARRWAGRARGGCGARAPPFARVELGRAFGAGGLRLCFGSASLLARWAATSSRAAR